MRESKSAAGFYDTPRHNGIDYGDYIDQLTYLLFLKVPDQIEASFEKARQQLDKLTPSLLGKAFRGELVPQDPNDEPAERLLERIRAARSPKMDK